MQGDIGVHDLIAKGVAIKSPGIGSFFHGTPHSPRCESIHGWKYIHVCQIRNKYAMDGYIACANVCWNDVAGGR